MLLVVAAARVDIQLQCPANMLRTAAERSTSAMLTWSADDFDIRSTNPVKYAYTAMHLMHLFLGSRQLCSTNSAADGHNLL